MENRADFDESRMMASVGMEEVWWLDRARNRRRLSLKARVHQHSLLRSSQVIGCRCRYQNFGQYVGVDVRDAVRKSWIRGTSSQRWAIDRGLVGDVRSVMVWLKSECEFRGTAGRALSRYRKATQYRAPLFKWVHSTCSQPASWPD